MGAISEALRQELLEDAIPNNTVVEPELSRDGDTDESEGLGAPSSSRSRREAATAQA